jgi:DNA-binding GntR family transcriptional regulator
MARDGSLKRQIYEKILQKITRNGFPLNEFLVEGKLAEMFGVSRAPVREALVELCNENILRNIPRTGYQIVQISRREIRDALQLRLILEIEGVRMACDRLTEEDIRGLNKLESELSQAADQKVINLDDWVKNGFHLHLTLAELSGNGLLYKMVRECQNILLRASVQIYLDSDYPSLEQPTYHLEILKAVINRDKEQAARCLKKDIGTLKKFLQEV